ncbi:MAG: T9SS type A sorting domain-containing protein [Saprospiraceae bacterium]|nr:T9SS type A sorting domain-containing protein [Saprospiraceae bacterium]
MFDKEQNDVEIFLISSVGQPLFFESNHILSGKSISVKDLPVGMYFLKIKKKNKYFFLKVLKV